SRPAVADGEISDPPAGGRAGVAKAAFPHRSCCGAAVWRSVSGPLSIPPDDSLMLSLQRINSRKSCPKGRKVNPYRCAREVRHGLRPFRTAPLTPSLPESPAQTAAAPHPPRTRSLPHRCPDGRLPALRADRRCGG